MEILRSHPSVVIQLSGSDIILMHLAFYEYQEFLKNNKTMRKDKRRQRLKDLNRLIALVDLLI